MLTTYCVSDLCRILFKTAISFQPSHDLSQIRIIITEEETGPGSLSKRPEACRVDGRRTSQAIKQNETETKTQTGPLLRPRLTDGLGNRALSPVSFLGPESHLRGDLGCLSDASRGAVPASWRPFPAPSQQPHHVLVFLRAL